MQSNLLHHKISFKDVTRQYTMACTACLLGECASREIQMLFYFTMRLTKRIAYLAGASLASSSKCFMLSTINNKKNSCILVHSLYNAYTQITVQPIRNNICKTRRQPNYKYRQTHLIWSNLQIMCFI